MVPFGHPFSEKKEEGEERRGMTVGLGGEDGRLESGWKVSE